MTLLNAADALYLGGRAVDRVYKGAVQVWPPILSAGLSVRATAVAGDGESGNSSTVTLTVPASVEVGDVLYVLTSAANSGLAWTAPSGWTSLGSATPGNVLSVHAWRRVAQSGDAGASVTFTHGGSRAVVAALVAISGADTATPEDVAVTVRSEAYGNPVVDGVTTTTDDALSLLLIGGRTQALGDTSSVWTTPTDYETEVTAHRANPSTRNARTALCTRPLPAAGATGDVTTGQWDDTHAWVAVHVAVRPA